MKILRMSGALGNQMVKYSVYLALKKRFPDEKIVFDDRIYDIDNISGRIVLNKLFGIEYERFDDFTTKEEEQERNKMIEELTPIQDEVAVAMYIQRVADMMKKKGYTLYRQYGEAEKGIVSEHQLKKDSIVKKLKSTNLFKKVFANKKLFEFVKNIYHKNRSFVELGDIYVDGSKCISEDYKNEILKPGEDAYFYCHWEQYDFWFREVEDEIRKAFVFPEICDEKNAKAKEIIESSNAVSVHIRRSEAVNVNAELFENNYYYKSIQHIKNNVENPVFFVFAFDMEWCKENKEYLGFSEDDKIIFVDWNIDDSFDCKVAFRDMQLMTLCKHNIIANSTFSFMGAYLNNNPDKIVCCSKDFGTRGFVNMMEG